MLALAVLVACAAVLWTLINAARSLNGLPDVGDPFDVAEAMRPIVLSDEDNAYVKYRDASRNLKRFTSALAKHDWTNLTWSQAEKSVRDYLDANRPALKMWLEGSERADALYHQPGEMAADTMLPVVQDLRTLSRLAGLEGSRIKEVGNLAEAWDCYKAMLRSSRHVGRHGIRIERLVGAASFQDSARRIIHWAEDPRLVLPNRARLWLM